MPFAHENNMMIGCYCRFFSELNIFAAIVLGTYTRLVVDSRFLYSSSTHKALVKTPYFYTYLFHFFSSSKHEEQDNVEYVECELSIQWYTCSPKHFDVNQLKKGLFGDIVVPKSIFPI